MKGRLFIAQRIHLYRPQYVMGVEDGSIVYVLGDLRAEIWGIRVPILWALDHLTWARILTKT